MRDEVKEWINNNVVLIEDEEYFQVIKYILNTCMYVDLNIIDELQNYYDSKNPIVLSNETIEFLKSKKNLFSLLSKYN